MLKIGPGKALQITNFAKQTQPPPYHRLVDCEVYLNGAPSRGIPSCSFQTDLANLANFFSLMNTFFHRANKITYLYSNEAARREEPPTSTTEFKLETGYVINDEGNVEGLF